MCLTRQRTEKEPREGSPVSDWTGRATEKDWPKRPSDGQLQEAWKKTPTGPYPLRQTQSVTQHTWHHQGPRKPSSCATFTLNPLGGRAATGKKKKQKQKAWHLCMQGHLSCVQLFATLWTVACQGSLSGGSPGKNTGVYGPILVAMAFYISCCPSRQPPWVPGAARTPATQAAAPPPHLASQGRPKSSREVSGANPSGRPTCRGGNKTRIETQGQCG